jgi:hypothetical protein
MSTVEVVFDGKTFVPTHPLDVPAGTKGTVEVPVYGTPPQPITEEHRRLWDEITREVEASEPYYPTLADAMKALRGEP